jgi:hypothetical protein
MLTYINDKGALYSIIYCAINIQEDSMRSSKVVTVLAAGALVAVMGWPAMAAPPVAGIIGYAHSTTSPDCPDLQWRLARHEDGTITGIFFYSDLSGTSEATGTVDKAGVFHVQLKSAMGKGPVGMVDGKRMADGKVVADMKGEGCANMHVEMTPISDVARYTPGGGGG